MVQGQPVPNRHGPGRSLRNGFGARCWPHSCWLPGTVCYLIWLFAFAPKLDIEFVPFFVAEYEKPEVPPLPWAESDRKAFQDPQSLGWKAEDPLCFKQITTEVATDILKRLRQKKTTDAVVVYLSTHALVDGSSASKLCFMTPIRMPPRPTAVQGCCRFVEEMPGPE